MNLTLGYAKDRLLAAGSHLQKAIIAIHNNDDLRDAEIFTLVHDGQNQLALALATLVQIEHDGAITAATPTEPTIKMSHLVNWLKGETVRAHPVNPGSYKYTDSEQRKLHAAIAVLESLHPSLLDE